MGTALGTVPDGVPGEKNGKILKFFENFIFLIFNLFFIKNMLLWNTFGKVKIDVLADVSQWNGLKITSIG